MSTTGKSICVGLPKCGKKNCSHARLHICTTTNKSCTAPGIGTPGRPSWGSPRTIKARKVKCKLVDGKEARIKGYTRSQCRRGHWHQSRLEADICDDLHALQGNKMVGEIFPQWKLDLNIHDHHITNHYVDFMVRDISPAAAALMGCRSVPAGPVFVEAKGQESDVWIIKRRLTEAIFSGYKYITLKRRLFK